MWIRTQDKRRLVKCVLFEIGLEKPTIFGYAKSGGVILGEYSSKEKALEVLESIQNCVAVNELCKMNKAAITFLNEDQLAEVIVFQMPQDDEAEVQE